MRKQCTPWTGLQLGNGDWRTGDARCHIMEGCWPAAADARAPCCSRARAVLIRACLAPARRGGRPGGGGRWSVTAGCGAAELRRAARAKERPRGAPAGVAAHPEQASPSRGSPESRGGDGAAWGGCARRRRGPTQTRLAEAQAGSGRRRHDTAPHGGAGGRDWPPGWDGATGNGATRLNFG